jgi:hypothetical protein
MVEWWLGDDVQEDGVQLHVGEFSIVNRTVGKWVDGWMGEYSYRV